MVVVCIGEKFGIVLQYLAIKKINIKSIYNMRKPIPAVYL
jgi:hypothetical protein